MGKRTLTDLPICSHVALLGLAERTCPVGVAGGEHRTTMPVVWGVLVRMLADSPTGQGPTAASMLQGGRKYLESGFVEHVTSIIHAHRAQVLP